MNSQSSHPVTSLVLRNVWSRQNRPKHGPSGNSQPPPAKQHVSVPAGDRDSSQGGSSVAYTVQGQNCTPSSSLNNSSVADITPSSTQWWSKISPTATPGTSSRNTPAPSGTSQTDSAGRLVSSPPSGKARTPTPLGSLENLPTSILNPDSLAIIANPLRTRATKRNQRQRQWQLQRQVVSTPQSAISGSRSIHRFGHSDMTHFKFATGRLF